jgi:hypothetical protein
MRLTVVAVACSMCCLLAGCEERQREEKTSRAIDIELVNALNNIGLESAIITEHTLYPYHFVPDGQELNHLGERDLAVLAAHLRTHPGVLNVRHGAVPPELYAARVLRVVEQLKRAGVAADRVKISDEMPGGMGMSSERVVMILTEGAAGTKREPPVVEERRITQ